MKQTRRILLVAALGVLVGCDKPAGSNSKAAFRGIDITGAEYARSLSLTDQHGQARTLEQFKGMVSVVFFGYTQCPDVCPATMAELAQVKKALGKDGERVQGVFITVDPERDTAEFLNKYVSNFDRRIIPLTGTADEIADVAKKYRAIYRKVPTSTGYTMDHTATVFLMDKAGKFAGTIAYQEEGATQLAKLKRLIAGK